jgi:hypothetical protein
MTVVPAETLTQKLFSGAAIAWALALYGLSMLSAASVRAFVSPWQAVAASSAYRWRTLQRWCASAEAGTLFSKVPPLSSAEGTARAVAAAMANAVGAHAVPLPEPPSRATLAFLGATRAA